MITSVKVVVVEVLVLVGLLVTVGVMVVALLMELVVVRRVIVAGYRVVRTSRTGVMGVAKLFRVVATA